MSEKKDRLSCPVCSTAAYENKGSNSGSSIFSCPKCACIIPIGWITHDIGQGEAIAQMSKWKGKVFKEDEMSAAAKKSAPKQAVGRKLLGKTTGLNVNETWVEAFKKSIAGKWGDAKVSEFMKSEFPGRKSAIFEIPGVRAVRSRFNHGRLAGQDGKAPATKAVSPETKAPAAKKRVVVKKK